jgi:hypothetical protein
MKNNNDWLLKEVTEYVRHPKNYEKFEKLGFFDE